MSYDAPRSAHEMPDCQAQIAEDVSDFPHLTYHDCARGDVPGHVFHLCACGFQWDDIEPDHQTD